MIVGRVLRKSVAVIVVAVVAGCGAQSQPQPPTDREWIANARGVVEQLRRDIVAVSGYDRVGAARAGLRDQSQLYGLLVSYTDFGGCRHMVAAIGVEPDGLAPAVVHLQRACVRLQDADRLFTRAVAGDAPHLLSRATRQALAAVRSLNAAALALARRP
jgi:hypothetical protein